MHLRIIIIGQHQFPLLCRSRGSRLGDEDGPNVFVAARECRHVARAFERASLHMLGVIFGRCTKRKEGG
jgi:hypothetical protein